MRNHDGYDARDSYKQTEDAMGENARNGNDGIESNGRRFQETLSDVAAVVYLNGTSPSKCRHSLCWHTKGHLWIEGFLKHYRWA